MQPNEFCALNQEVQQALARVDAGTWPCPYIALTYHTTVVCLSINDLPDLAEAMQEAAAGIEHILELGDIDASAHVMCPSNRPHIAGFAGPNKQVDQISNSHLLHN